MAVRAIICIAALLLVCLEVTMIGGHDCTKNELVHCDNSPRLNISKSYHFYYLRIPMCSNDQCAADVPEIVDGIQWIDCNHICQRCKNVTGQDCGTNNSGCENKLDRFLDSFCKNITLAATTTSPFIVPINATDMLNITTTASPTPSQLDTLDQCRATTMTTIVSPSQSQQPPACTCSSSAMPVESPSLSSSSLESTEKSDQTTCMNSAMALEVLLALAVVLLAVVTTGWVCTCIVTKKRQSLPQNTKDVNVNNVDENDGERIFHNPTYQETLATQPHISNYTEVSEQENPSAAMYDTVKPPTQAKTENGPTYDVLKRGQADGNNQAKDTGKTTKDETYSKLGLHN